MRSLYYNGSVGLLLVLSLIQSLKAAKDEPTANCSLVIPRGVWSGIPGINSCYTIGSLVKETKENNIAYCKRVIRQNVRLTLFHTPSQDLLDYICSQDKMYPNGTYYLGISLNMSQGGVWTDDFNNKPIKNPLWSPNTDLTPTNTSGECAVLNHTDGVSCFWDRVKCDTRHFSICEVQDINQCTSGTGCGANTDCLMTGVQNVSCTCYPGFAYDNNSMERSCSDINECVKQDICSNKQCVNTPGSYKCGCEDGTTYKDGKCVKDGSNIVIYVLIPLLLVIALFVSYILWNKFCGKKMSESEKGDDQRVKEKEEDKEKSNAEEEEARREEEAARIEEDLRMMKEAGDDDIQSNVDTGEHFHG